VGRDSPAMGRAVDWLLDRQITASGDWSKTVDAAPGAWCFEYNNDFYPDCDDTAMVLMALQSQFDKSQSDKSVAESRLTASVARCWAAWMRCLSSASQAA